uniref:SUN domain-containing protein n=1 Tax=Kryptolebias marmoratus TaxID=37003 RepID=A0A3Q3A4F9_KRYMA
MIDRMGTGRVVLVPDGSPDTLISLDLMVLLINGSNPCSPVLQAVRVMVTDALRLFAQDRIGLADYALESGDYLPPDVHPGNCWAFKGSKGFLVIQLSMRILPTAVTMEHVPKVLAPSRTLRSAPRDFSVYVIRQTESDVCFQGLRDESQEEGKLLGSFTYEEDGEDLQTFSVSVLSNWGHPDYTCMYRFRVHGTPSDV